MVMEVLGVVGEQMEFLTVPSQPTSLLLCFDKLTNSRGFRRQILDCVRVIRRVTNHEEAR
jgi:hypothetical protein